MNFHMEKPDLTAPGVGINAPGTAVTMEAMRGDPLLFPCFFRISCASDGMGGITKGNDPYCMGKKNKAYYHAAAPEPLPEYKQYPNYEVGVGSTLRYVKLPQERIAPSTDRISPVT